VRLSPREGAIGRRPDVVARADELEASGEAGRGFRTMGDGKRNCVMVAKGAPACARLRAAAPPPAPPHPRQP